MMHPDSQSQSQSDVELFGFENKEQLEQAMLVALRAGERQHLLRLMRRCGPCMHMLRPQLQTYLCESIVGILSTGAHEQPTVRQLLPWLEQAVRCGVVAILPPRVREMLASALQSLSNIPGQDSITACQLFSHFVTPSGKGGLWYPPSQ